MAQPVQSVNAATAPSTGQTPDAVAAVTGAPPNTPAPNIAPVTPATTPSGPAAPGQGTVSQNGALDVIAGQLEQWFSPTDAAALAQDAWNLIVNGTTSTAQIDQWIRGTQAYQTTFAGFIQAKANGFDSGDTESDYLGYLRSAQQMARTAGFTLTPQEAGDLYAQNVSAGELNDRINNGVTDYLTMSQSSRDALAAWGVSPGSMVNYMLDPDNALPKIEQQLSAAKIAGAGADAGISGISQAQATQLAALGITQDTARSGFGAIAPLAASLTTALPGQEGTGNTLSLDQLIGAQFTGNGADQMAVQHAEETRAAPSKGGGGAIASASGVQGAGYAQQ